MPPVQTCVCEQLPPSVQLKPPSPDALLLVLEQPEADRPTIARRRTPEVKLETRMLQNPSHWEAQLFRTQAVTASAFACPISPAMPPHATAAASKSERASAAPS